MRKLLGALWPHAGLAGAVTFWLAPSKESLHLPLVQIHSLGDDDVAELAAMAGDQHVYYGLGLRRLGLTGQQQGGKKDTIAMPGIVIDIDFYNPKAHKAQNLPRDLDEAAVILDGYPDPSAIVHTGNGVHVYWFFRDYLILDSLSRQTMAQKAYKAWHTPLVKRAKERGWQLDDTASLQRVWRVPGFINQKTSKPVELLYCDADVRYSFEELGLDIAQRRASSMASSDRDSTPPGTAGKTVDLEIIRDRLRRITSDNRFHKAIKAVLEGKSMADPGDRDKTLQGVCSTIAWMPEARRADPAVLAELLRPSLAVWADEDDAEKTLDEEMEKARDKIARNQEDYFAQRAKAMPQLQGIARALGVKIEDDKDGGADVDGRDMDLLLQHAILQFRSVYHVFDFRTHDYSRPRTQKELIPFLRDAWADGPNTLSIHYVNDKGQTKTKTVDRLAEEYCTVIDESIGDMSIDRCEYKAGPRIFIEAVARKRITEPRYDPQIDTWLRLMVGNDRFSDGVAVIDRLLDWIATVPKLSEQNSALYLDGASGAGKGLLANGLARLWRDGNPTPFVNTIKDFNQEIVQCPLIWIDEGVPGRNGNITGELRALVGQSSMTVNEKFLNARTVRGAIRLMICANNQNVLLLGDAEMSTADLQAVVGRILHVHVKEEAALYLQEYNRDGSLTRSWVEGGLIAQHCLHLAETREIKRGRRFLVEGDETEMHRRLAMQGETNGLVYEWLVRFASDPEKLLKSYRGGHRAPLALIGDDSLLVNAQAVIDGWELYMQAVRRPNTTRIGRVLAQLSYRKARIGPRGDRNWFHAIKVDLVLEWCRQNQIGSEERIQDNLRKVVTGDSTQTVDEN